ncbi:MAG: diguanylate cyclase [Lachnospiraceae bacterium]|nr:diguanylate cyclase [Candidatus Merdinaster equi]
MIGRSKETGEVTVNQDELVKNIVKTCIKSTCVVLVCIILFELFFYINCWNHAQRFGWIGPWYRACYLSLLIASVIALVMVIYCNRDYDKRYVIMKWLSPIYSTLITAWALSITYLDCLKSQKCSPIIIMTILLCVPACMYVNARFYFVLNTIANLTMLSMLIWAPGGGDSADLYNYLVFAIIQTIVSRFLLATRYNYHKSAQEVIRHEKEVVELRVKEEKMEQQKKQAEEMTLLLIKTLSDTIEAKDEYTRGHSNRVSEYSALIARKMGLPEEEVSNIKYAATLHDIGKIGVPDTILNKPLRLTDEEYEIIKKHSSIGADILKNIDVISYTADIARHHHERYDGKGYPEGLKGDENSIGARIVAVADSFDAMNSERIYRKPLSREIIINEITKNRGIQFDPDVADAFLELLEAGEIDKVESKKEVEEVVDSGSIINEEAERLLSAVVNTMRSSNSGTSTDYLTGLMLRGSGEEKIVELMKNKPGALVFCDMDNLKTINDRYGHKCGDKALKYLGEVIGKYAEKGVACRVGGDEFLLYLDDVNEETVVKTLETIKADFKAAIENDSSISIATLSSGVCLTTPNDLYSTVLSKADKALYHVKQAGKAGFYIYHEELDSDNVNNHVDINQVTKIIEGVGEYDGALDVEHRQFAKMYDYLLKVCERYNHSCSVVLVTLDSRQNKTMYIDDIEKSMQYMGMAIKNTIRNVDICTRYSSMQYLIVLLEAGNSNVDDIMNRIFASFYKMNSDSDLIPRYEVSPLLVRDKKDEK